MEAALGGEERLAALSSAEAKFLEIAYFEALGRISRTRPGQIVIDKFPLTWRACRSFHRIFPDADRLRPAPPVRHGAELLHGQFQLNRAMLSFTDLEEAARLYEAVLDSWTRAGDLLPLRVHTLRYERMSALEGRCAPCSAFWTCVGSQVLDNRAGAAGRGLYPHRQYAGRRADLRPRGGALAALSRADGARSCRSWRHGPNGSATKCERGARPQALRHEGYRLQSEGRHAEAAARYQAVVARAPGDWEIWNNLGNARRAAGDRAGAVAALRRPATCVGASPPFT